MSDDVGQNIAIRCCCYPYISCWGFAEDGCHNEQSHLCHVTVHPASETLTASATEGMQGTECEAAPPRKICIETYLLTRCTEQCNKWRPRRMYMNVYGCISSNVYECMNVYVLYIIYQLYM